MIIEASTLTLPSNFNIDNVVYAQCIAYSAVKILLWLCPYFERLKSSMFRLGTIDNLYDFFDRRYSISYYLRIFYCNLYLIFSENFWTFFAALNSEFVIIISEKILAFK